MNKPAMMLILTSALVSGTVMTVGSGAAWAQAASGGGWQEGNRATQALNMLEDQGYTRFSNFQANGQDFTADVLKGNRTMQVTIDPASGQIHRSGAASAMWRANGRLIGAPDWGA
ncbi:MAG: hypothetical protein B7Z80_09225 [Rhodospirillales bacterium 20-64-7]|nr:MAG: hypothetical protein B7Z80_09225 [Rhodospirillales bacterium 20-64-7]